MRGWAAERKVRSVLFRGRQPAIGNPDAGNECKIILKLFFINQLPIHQHRHHLRCVNRKRIFQHIIYSQYS